MPSAGARRVTGIRARRRPKSSGGPSVSAVFRRRATMFATIRMFAAPCRAMTAICLGEARQGRRRIALRLGRGRSTATIGAWLRALRARLKTCPRTAPKTRTVDVRLQENVQCTVAAPFRGTGRTPQGPAANRVRPADSSVARLAAIDRRVLLRHHRQAAAIVADPDPIAARPQLLHRQPVGAAATSAAAASLRAGGQSLGAAADKPQRIAIIAGIAIIELFQWNGDSGVHGDSTGLCDG
jgi:hypothetical protein